MTRLAGEALSQARRKLIQLRLDAAEGRDQHLAGGGHLGRASRRAARTGDDQRSFGEVVQRLDRVPGALVAEPDILGGGRDRAAGGDRLQQPHPRLADAGSLAPGDLQHRPEGRRLASVRGIHGSSVPVRLTGGRRGLNCMTDPVFAEESLGNPPPSFDVLSTNYRICRTRLYDYGHDFG